MTHLPTHMTTPSWSASLCSTEEELQQILQLQAVNLASGLSPAELIQEGFVTLKHDLATLQQMHRLSPSVIVKDNDSVIGYALTMLPAARQLIPDLEPMFRLMEGLSWEGNKLESKCYYVMGQVCIAKEFRGQGIFEALYRRHRDTFRGQFELMVTEIATRNHRSLRAHQRIGFKHIHTHTDELDEWAVVAWDWS